MESGISSLISPMFDVAIPHCGKQSVPEAEKSREGLTGENVWREQVYVAHAADKISYKL